MALVDTDCRSGWVAGRRNSFAARYLTDGRPSRIACKSLRSMWPPQICGLAMCAKGMADRLAPDPLVGKGDGVPTSILGKNCSQFSEVVGLKQGVGLVNLIQEPEQLVGEDRLAKM